MGWEIFALTAVGLFAKQVVLVTVQAFDRMRTKTFRHPEDAELMNANVGESALTTRAQSAIANSLENEPAFLLILFGFLAIHVDGSFQPHRSAWESAELYAIVFVGARWAHMVLFLLQRAGIRTLAYAVGLLATLGLGVRIVMDVLGGS
jgi:uncharacterized MAPEG superfamily protein